MERKLYPQRGCLQHYLKEQNTWWGKKCLFECSLAVQWLGLLRVQFLLRNYDPTSCRAGQGKQTSVAVMAVWGQGQGEKLEFVTRWNCVRMSP